MGRLANDEIFVGVLEEERRKIPRFMRMSPQKMKIIYGIFGAIGLLEILVLCLFPRWWGAKVFYETNPDGSLTITKMYPFGYITAIIAVAALTIPIFIYLLFVRKFEKDAFQEASRRAVEQKELQAASARREDRLILERAAALEQKSAPGLKGSISDPSLEKDTSAEAPGSSSLFAPVDADLADQILGTSKRKVPDEIDLFVPDQDIEIFKKKE